jgi:hypothetical protein
MPTGTAKQTGHPTIEIRRLGMFDVDEMRSLNALFADAFDEATEGYTAPQPNDAYLEQTLSQSHIIALYSKLGTREDVQYFDIKP